MAKLIHKSGEGFIETTSEFFEFWFENGFVKEEDFKQSIEEPINVIEAKPIRKGRK